MDHLSSPLVLMYHGILSQTPNQVPSGRETGAGLYDIPIGHFKAQMQWLKQKGFTPTLCENIDRSSEATDLIITFDDGELNNFQNAFPVLKEFGWKAYFFIIVKRVGKNGYMDWKELKELSDSGMIIGSHGLTHEILTNLLDSQMVEELRASKQNLEINLGIPIDTISVPRGFCNDKVIETAYKLGYKTIFISERPSCLKSKCLSRIAIKSNWSIKRFDLALNGKTPVLEIIGGIFKKTLKAIFRESGYNWVRGVIIKLSQ